MSIHKKLSTIENYKLQTTFYIIINQYENDIANEYNYHFKGFNNLNDLMTTNHFLISE